MRKGDGAGRGSPPRQARSRGTLDRLAVAARELVLANGVDALTVGEVARRAGTSVGNFYRRFPSKDALLAYLEDEFLAGRDGAWEVILDPAAWEGTPALAIAERIAREIVERHREHEDFLRLIAQRERAAYDARAASSHHESARKILALLRPRIPIRHPRPELAVAFALEMLGATAGEMILFGRARAVDADFSDDELIAELARMFIAYLQLGDAEAPR